MAFQNFVHRRAALWMLGRGCALGFVGGSQCFSFAREFEMSILWFFPKIGVFLLVGNDEDYDTFGVCKGGPCL